MSRHGTLGAMSADSPRIGRDDVIPGFLVRRLADDVLEATRIHPLDDILKEYSCQERVLASNLGELELLCCAERIKEGLIFAAVRLCNDTQPWRDPT